MKRKYGFVVLNYNNPKDTIECVESILSIDDKNYEIVVVDNCSTDNSFEILKHEFEGKLEVLKSEKNGGYSYGNNVGIKYLFGKNIKNICIATSDTLVLSKDILSQLDLIISKDIGLIGPNIITPENLFENPVMKNLTMLYIMNIYFPKTMKFIRKTIYFIIPFIFRFRQKKIQIVKERFDKVSDVYMIHGSFLVMTENYFDKIGFFDEDLFMYGEEDILAYQSCINNLKIVYTPNIKVLHKGEASTKNVHKGSLSTFRIETEKNSNKVLRKKLNFFILIKNLFR